MGFGDEEHRDKLILSHNIKGTCHHRELSMLVLTLLTWLRWCLSDFREVTLFNLFKSFFLKYKITLFSLVLL